MNYQILSECLISRSLQDEESVASSIDNPRTVPSTKRNSQQLGAVITQIDTASSQVVALGSSRTRPSKTDTQTTILLLLDCNKNELLFPISFTDFKKDHSNCPAVRQPKRQPHE